MNGNNRLVMISSRVPLQGTNEEEIGSLEQSCGFILDSLNLK